MTAAVLPVQRDLAGLFRAALDTGGRLRGARPRPRRACPSPALERPRLPEHGDWATNVALVLAKAAKAPPRAVAEAMVAHLRAARLGGRRRGGRPRLRQRPARPALVRRRWSAGSWPRGRAFGTVDLGHGERVNVEFVSANPTGPLHVGNARLAPIGDALANLLTATGHKVEREYYINDAGGQIEQLGASVEAAYLSLLGGRPRRRPTATKAPTSPTLATDACRAEQGDALADLDSGRAPGPRHRLGLPPHAGRDQADPGPGSGSSSTFSSSTPSTRPAPSPRPSTTCASGGWSRTATGRCGCAPPSSGTTRTGR